MQRKVVGILVAVVAALMGTVLLVRYVQTAEDRATAGEDLVEVYVIETAIPAGTNGGEALGDYLRVEAVPMKVQAEGAVRSLASLENKVTAVALVPGEQLVSQRFVTQADFINREVGVIVPEGMVEVTIDLEPQRAVGGLIEPGDTVAIIASFEEADGESDTVIVDGEEVALPSSISGDGALPETTGFVMRKVLITALQENVRNAPVGEEDAASNRLEQSPTGNLLITVALDPADAERLVFVKEFGLVWLASERSTVPEYESDQQNRGNVYLDPPRPPAFIQAANG